MGQLSHRCLLYGAAAVGLLGGCGSPERQPDVQALPESDQERVFGRRKHDAMPLPGGEEVDLSAKTPDGEYVIPADAHARRAHPLTVGAGLMLCRSYNYAEGLIFISFQRELRTFVNTMYRMADGDALLRYAMTISSAAFRIPPLNWSH